jgi:hypothetical protein
MPSQFTWRKSSRSEKKRKKNKVAGQGVCFYEGTCCGRYNIEDAWVDLCLFGCDGWCFWILQDCMQHVEYFTLKHMLGFF